MHLVGNKRGCSLVLLLSVAEMWLPKSLEAQLVADGTTNILDGISTNIAGTISIGTNGSFTLLVLTNGATASISSTGSIGFNATARSNSLVVVGPGSVWSNASLAVGGFGSFSQLSILNGGVVTGPGNSFVGQYSGTNNSALISGAGSVWTNGNFTIGQSGPANQMTITNGGAVASGSVTIGFTGSNNLATVTSTGSIWRCSSLMLGTVPVGPNKNHRLLINNGGVVTNSGNCIIGSNSQSNSVLVTDPGTVFWNGSYIRIGQGNRGNQLVVSNGAVATAAYTYVQDSNGSNDTVIITGNGSLMTNQADFHLGHGGPSNLLFVSNGGTLADNSGYIATAGLGGNQVVIAGPKSIWTNGSDFYVGYLGPRNQLIVSNAGAVFDNNGIIGGTGTASSNKVVVTGVGSLWTNRSSLYIGQGGGYCQLLITDGATVVSGNSFVQSSRNQILVSDSGSLWKTLTNLTLGPGGDQITVSNGGTVQAYNLTIANANQSALGNRIDVNGGSVIVTNNVAGSTFLIGIFGVLNLNSGFIAADTLALGSGFGGVATFNFNGGTLQTRGTFWDYPPPYFAPPFVVGNGGASATYELLAPSSGPHRFGEGLVISSNAFLKGIGTISGDVSISAGGTLSPGSSIGQIILNGNLLLNDGSTNCMELNADNGTSDSLVGMTNLTYGGTLLVTNIAGALVDGSFFRLFTASNYSGAFMAIVPASPGPGLKWNTNELNVDGVLRVFALQTTPPTIAGIQLAGSNLQIMANGGVSYDPCYLLTATNISPPITWEILNTNVFDSGGKTTFALPNLPSETTRFFRLQVN
jgi:T5SS/PEP-CTERM-associated repeat protein